MSSSNDWKDFLGTNKESNICVIKKIVKRDGSIEQYDRYRISSAIAKAFESCHMTISSKDVEILTKDVEAQIKVLMSSRHENSVPAIEEIQDIIEDILVKNNHLKPVKAFILYRAKRENVRDTKKLMLDIDSTMDGYLQKSDWRVNENANVNFSLGGLILHNSGAITANYWLKNIYTDDIAEAHKNASFHIHDLSMFSGYCAGWSLRQLINEGLGGVQDKIQSKPANHLLTLVQQIVNFLGIMQNEWAGAQALSSFDTYLAPFIKVDNLEEATVKQALQSFLFGINTPSRWGSQAPFTNITLDWVCPSDLKDKPALVGGKEQSFTYGDCKEEMALINKLFIELMLEGDADGRGFQYPIPTYNITRDFDWDGDNTDLLFKMTAKYGTPYFQNFVNSDLNPEDVRSMCCRLQLDKRELRKRGGGLFGSDEFTGSIGVVTINLPRIGYLAKSKTDFYNKLYNLMDIAAQSLIIKRKVVNRLLENGLFPYTKKYLSHLNNHFSTIGICGMNECLVNFMGKDLIDDEARSFANEILIKMRDKLSEYQEESGDLFNLEATPAESTSYRLARHDKQNFPDIISSGDEDPYYTNSSQLPVDFTEDIFEALDLQEELQIKYTGGTVFHGLLGEEIKDIDACKNLIKTICSNYKIPYFTISPVYSICPVHGYLAGKQFNCPKCEQEKKEKMIKEIESLEKAKAQLINTMEIN